MRRTKFIAVLAVVCVFGVVFSVHPAGDSEAEAIKGVIAKCAEALQSQDWDALESVCTSDWMQYSHMGDKWDMAATKDFFEKHITEHTINFSDVVVHVSDDGSMAWATFNEQTEYKFDGKPVKEKAIFTAAFENVEGAWKMKHLHRSAPPPPPPAPPK